MSSSAHLRKNIEAFSGAVNCKALEGPLSHAEDAHGRGVPPEPVKERPIAAPADAEVVCLGTSGIAALRPLMDNGARVVIIEPDLQQVARILSREDLSAAIRAGVFELIIDADPDEVVRQWQPVRGGREAKKLLLVNGIGGSGGSGVATESGAESSRADYFRVVLDGIQARERDQALDTGAMMALGPLAVENAVSNLANVELRFPIELFQRFRGLPAVLVAAGPSLDDNAVHLSKLGERALIIAVDTAVKPLLAKGIEPHLVVGVDPRERNVRNLDGADLRRSTLITELSSHPALTARPSAGAASVLADGVIGRALSKLDVGVPVLSMYGSVATAAFELACRMSASPVVFMGQDLAFTGGQQYGAHVERRSSIAPTRDELRVVKDVHGRNVETTERLLAFRDWLEARMRHYPSTTFLNATGAGILTEGVESVDAAALATHLTSASFPSLDVRLELDESFQASPRGSSRGRDAVLQLRREIHDCLAVLSSAATSKRTDGFLPKYLENEVAAGLTEVLCAEALRALTAKWNEQPRTRRERELRRILTRGARRLNDIVSAALEGAG